MVLAEKKNEDRFKHLITTFVSYDKSSTTSPEAKVEEQEPVEWRQYNHNSLIVTVPHSCYNPRILSLHHKLEVPVNNKTKLSQHITKLLGILFQEKLE